ncbi:hypothetical protein T02_5782 [Trichinella nativa]|uniref:Uncharacterized protein n=1 Tax=Trichinella nativa TaxID=6335 RepID=A0A0V1LCI5_9BILA|nr:hypothetical protein T02_5782 [Trichinella nativa]
MPSVEHISFGRIAAPPEQIQGTYAEPRFSSLDKYFYSLHRRGRSHVFNYDSTVIKKDMADKQEMYPLQFHKRFYFQMNRNSLGQNVKVVWITLLCDASDMIFN